MSKVQGAVDVDGSAAGGQVYSRAGMMTFRSERDLRGARPSTIITARAIMQGGV